MEFKDKKDRNIILQFNEDWYFDAVHNDQVIGTFEFYQDQGIWGARPELIYMNVQPDYQGAGIGNAIMGFAVKELSYFILPRPGSDVDAPNYLTIEGAKFISRCFSNGTLSERFERQYQG